MYQVSRVLTREELSAIASPIYCVFVYSDDEFVYINSMELVPAIGERSIKFNSQEPDINYLKEQKKNNSLQTEDLYDLNKD